MTGKELEPARSGRPRDGTSRAIAKAAFATAPEGWEVAKAIATLPAGGATILASTIADYEAKLVALAEREPQLNGPMAKAVADAFAPIGAKMRPDMGIEQAGFWTAALVKAFSDLPAFIVREALGEAIHVPFQFPTEMEKGVRDLAERKLEDHRRAVRRLQMMRDELQRALAPDPALAPPSDEPLGLDDVRATPKWLRSLGRTSGAIRAEDLAIVEAEEAEEARRSDEPKG